MSVKEKSFAIAAALTHRKILLIYCFTLAPQIWHGLSYRHFPSSQLHPQAGPSWQLHPSSMPQPPRTPRPPRQLLVPCVPCSQHHGTEGRPAVPQANLQISLNYHGRCSCCTPRAKLCITDELLQHLAGSKRHSLTPFPKQTVGSQAIPAF